LNVSGLQGIVTPESNTYGPVQTLLLLYNKNQVYGPTGPFQVVFARESSTLTVGVQALLNMSGSGTRWSNIDPPLANTPVHASRRENASGTRNTEYVNIQRMFSNPSQFVADDTMTVNQGTGPMLNYVDLEFGAFGYAFVGGIIGDRRANIRVGGYTDHN